MTPKALLHGAKGAKFGEEGKIGSMMILPCGVAFRANKSILVEEIFHGAGPVK